MTVARRVAGAAVLVALAASPLSAQTWRTLDVARQRADSAPVSVSITYGTGSVGVRPTSGPLLYHMDLRFDSERSQPRHSFDPSTRKLELGLQRSDARFASRPDNESGHLQLELSKAPPLDMTFDLGAVEADLDLSGLRITRLRLESGASETTVRFDSINAVRMGVLDVSLGVASFRGLRLANANAADVRVDAGVGNVELDFGGQWTQDIELRLEATIGIVTVHVPSDVGVRLSLRKVLAAFDHEGLIERDGAWVSPNWESAARKLRINAETRFGKFTLDRTGR